MICVSGEYLVEIRDVIVVELRLQLDFFEQPYYVSV